MADITHGTWIKDGKAVDAVYQNGIKVYGRNLIKGGAHQTILAGTSNYNYKVFFTDLVPHQTYTLSMIANLKGSSDNLISACVYGNSFNAPALLIQNMVADGTATKWQFTVPNTGMVLIIYTGKQGAASGIEADIKQLKLETGDQTAFSIAPEDILK